MVCFLGEMNKCLVTQNRELTIGQKVEVTRVKLSDLVSLLDITWRNGDNGLLMGVEMTAMWLYHQSTQHCRWQWTESWIVEYSTQLSDNSIICRMSCQICSVGRSPFSEPQLPWENHPTVFKVYAFLEKYGPSESD